MISVVIATYNRSKLLKKSIESVLNQTYNKIELIIIDDGSVDDTQDVVKNISDKRIRYVRLDENKGSTIARNVGLDNAIGDFIIVWDSDDVLHFDAFEKIMSIFSKEPSAGIVSAPAHQICIDQTIVYKKVNTGFVSLPQILCKHLPNNEKVRVVRSKIFKHVRYKARNIDFIVNCELASFGKWYHFSEELGDLYLESDKYSLTKERKKTNVKRSIERFVHIVEYLNRFGTLLKNNCPGRYAAHAYGASVGLLLSGKNKQARIYAFNASKYSDWSLKYVVFALFTYLPFSSRILYILIKVKNKHSI